MSKAMLVALVAGLAFVLPALGEPAEDGSVPWPVQVSPVQIAATGNRGDDCNCPPGTTPQWEWDLVCLDFDVDRTCSRICAGLCAVVCACTKKLYLGIPCAIGCSDICTILCEYCADWETVWTCTCVGGGSGGKWGDPVMEDEQDHLE